VRRMNPLSVLGFDRGGPPVVHGTGRGATLVDVLTAGPLELAAALVLYDDCLAALDALHAAGLLHLDVQPGTVTIDVDGTVLVRDAGLVEALPNDGGDPRGWGSVAPEVLAELSHSSAADVHAATAVLVLALTALPMAVIAEGAAAPWEEETPNTLEASIPVGARELVRRGMAAAPAARGSLAERRGEVTEAAAAFLGEGWRREGRAQLAALALDATRRRAIALAALAPVEVPQAGRRRRWVVRSGLAPAAALLLVAGTAVIAAAINAAPRSSPTAGPDSQTPGVSVVISDAPSLTPDTPSPTDSLTTLPASATSAPTRAPSTRRPSAASSVGAALNASPSASATVTPSPSASPSPSATATSPSPSTLPKCATPAPSKSPGPTKAPTPAPTPTCKP
jgi:hypothetical protein